MKLLLANYRFLLGGGCDGEQFHQQLASFWTCYEFYQPNHEVFKKDKSALSSTIPLLVHGDEGRYLKKGNFMVCTIECALGCDTDKKEKKPRCECGSDPLLSRYGNIGLGREGDAAFLQAIGTASQQHVNDSGNEFLSKFLVFGMSSLIYKKHKGILTQAFEMVAADLKQLHDVGITIQGHTFFASTIGCKGDLKFHHQVGNLQRSYYNVGVRENHPICSLCLAGTNGVHFEDVSANPVWLQTMYTQKPWNEGCCPALATIPFEVGCEEAIFRLDLFHCWKCGLGRDLTGSTLIIMCQLQYFDFEGDDQFNLPARLGRAHSSFSLWCLANHKSPALHSFSKSLLNFKNQKSFAWFNVKGSDLTLLTAWLLFVVKCSREIHGERYSALEAALIETFESAKIVFGVLHSHQLWLSRLCAQRVQHHLTVLVRGYKCLAREARLLRIVAYGLKPKLHAVDHINRDLQRQLNNGAPRVLNCMVFSCEANESVVGHVSRLSRRVSSRTVSHRVLDRICIKVKCLIRRWKAKLRLGRSKPKRKR